MPEPRSGLTCAGCCLNTLGDMPGKDRQENLSGGSDFSEVAGCCSHKAGYAKAAMSLASFSCTVFDNFMFKKCTFLFCACWGISLPLLEENIHVFTMAQLLKPFFFLFFYFSRIRMAVDITSLGMKILFYENLDCFFSILQPPGFCQR